MTHFSLLDMLSSLPLPFDATTVETGMENWRASIADPTLMTPNGSLVIDVAGQAAKEPGARQLLEAIFGNSPFLSHCVNRDPGLVCDLLVHGPDATAKSILKRLSGKRKESFNESALMRELRIAKRQMAVTIAIADIGEIWPLDKITRYISDTAAAALSVAASHLIRDAAKSGAFELGHANDPEKGSGLIVLGMGKLGAFELNYSSDIDLIVLYDADRITTSSPEKLQNRLVRLTRGLIRMMDERTADGYVFRMDLRLRPDPGATPLALSVTGAETYYESLGQNWERAAMIKARAIAGDLDAGQAFLKHLTPFVWRKSLDFAAIQDIHSIKRQIDAHRGSAGIRAEGHNIKLGQGGIREIEFFAQTQQLIWGGREPGLRSPHTVQALHDLVTYGQCDRQTADDLITSYTFLRRVEHRLQMINDEQTQTVPEAAAEFDRLSCFLGYDKPEQFRNELGQHLRRTHDHYGKLFADAPSLGADGKGNLSFTGSDSDPETLNTIAALGFADPAKVDALVRGWHHGRYRAVRSTRAREILTEMLPTLLNAMGKTPDPDTALLKFDEFLQGLPAGVQLFSMIQANPPLMTLLAEIMGMAPRLADHLSSRPAVLDSVLAPDFFQPLPSSDALQEELSRLLGRAEFMEDVLNFSRRWAHDRRFQVGVQRLRGLIPPDEAAAAHSDIAEAAVNCLFAPVAAAFADIHGTIAGGEIAVLALGRLGSREMTARSDLDLVIIYQAPYQAPHQASGTAVSSDGDKPLSVSQYFARLSQRLINALTALTPEGGLFEVDMRLRPSGNAGPIATTLAAFTTYHQEQAWTWEHMALTRARVILSTSPEMRTAVQHAVRSIVTSNRSHEKLLIDVAAMRARLAREKPADTLWSLKQVRGGTLDIEFIAQYLALRHGADTPDIVSADTATLIRNLMAYGYLNTQTGRLLGRALALFQALQGMLSLTIEDHITDKIAREFSDDLKARLAHVGGCKSFQAVEDKVQSYASEVFLIFQEIVAQPAATLKPDNKSD